MTEETNKFSTKCARECEKERTTEDKQVQKVQSKSQKAQRETAQLCLLSSRELDRARFDGKTGANWAGQKQRMAPVSLREQLAKKCQCLLFQIEKAQHYQCTSQNCGLRKSQVVLEQPIVKKKESEREHEVGFL